MNGFKIVLPLAILSLILSLVHLTQGQSSGFVIERADASNTVPLVDSTELSSLLDEVKLRFIVEYANSLLHYQLTPIPATLQTLLDQVNDRFVIQYANANRHYVIEYPLELIDDTIPPQATAPEIDFPTDGSVRIVWATNELTKGRIDYGTQSGQYTENKSEEVYSKHHEVILSGLVDDTTYYFRLTNTDRSGNISRGPERNFTVVTNGLIYFPVVQRER